MARFSIGIPTYNRPDLLRRSIESALDQSWPDVEVIVNDDGPSPETAEVVRSFGGRVRFHQNDVNQGAAANFEKVCQLATGEFFSWLQDDDLIHRDFARHAAEALSIADDVAAYVCFSIRTPSPITLYEAVLAGPAVPMPWMRGGVTVMDGFLISPVSLFYSFGNPPALAYRTESLRSAYRAARHRCILFDERILLATAAVDARVAVEPWAGAVFSSHYGQDHQRIFRTDPMARSREWRILADAIGALLDVRPESWKGPLMDFFRDLDIQYRLNWLNDYCPPDPEAWRTAHPIAGRVRAMLIETIPESARHRINGDRDTNGPGYRRVAKAIARDLIPPILLRTMRRMRRGQAS